MKSRVIDQHIGEIDSLQDLIDTTGRVYCGDIRAVWQQSKKREFWKTYAEFRRDIVAAANYLTLRGVVGKRIAVMGALDYDWLVAFFGIMCSGNIAVPLDAHDNLLEEKVNMAELFGLYMNRSVRHAPEIAEQYHVNRFPPEQFYQDYAVTDQTGFLHDAHAQEDAIIVFTSGTTGKGKGVVLTHQNVVADAKCGVHMLGEGIGEADTTMPVLPPTHMLELTVGIITPLFYGVTLCFGGGIKYIHKSMKRFSPRVLVLVPMVVENLYSKIEIQIRNRLSERKFKWILRLTGWLRKIGIDLRTRVFREVHREFGGSLQTIVCGGSSMDPDVIRQMDALGIAVLEGYGITECSPVISCNRHSEWCIGSVGKKAPSPYCEVKVMEGELCVKGDIVFKEYFNDPEATAKAKQNGWFKTGDLCQIDPDGYIHIIGRSKNLIILSDGNNVSPEEIEGYFSGHSCIKSIFVSESQEKKNCLVASVHPEWDPDQEATYEEVKEKIKHHFRETNKTLPAYKRVNEIVFYDQDFEKTALGKIRRFKYEKETKEHAG